MSEQHLVEEAKVNSIKFGELYDKYFDKIYTYIFRRVSDRETAQDLCSKTFIKALEGLKGYYYTGAPFSAWLYKIAHNTVIDHYKQANKYNVISIEDQENFIKEDSKQSEILEKKELFNKIIRAMELMESTDREVIMMKYLEEMSNKEISEIMDLSPNHVGVKLFRSLKKLRTLVDQYL
jgi:RNA polymerase sigma-70 factor (ECF subfamily)